MTNQNLPVHTVAYFKLSNASMLIVFIILEFNGTKSRLENPQKLTELSPSSHPRHLVEKMTAQKDTKDTTSDSQVNKISHTGGHRLV